MRKEEEVVEVHPEGELQISGNPVPELGASVDTFAGKVNVRWVPEAAVSGLGLMVFFIEFLKTSGLFDKFVEDCPLSYTSANAPEKRDGLGTLLLSVLAGHWQTHRRLNPWIGRRPFGRAGGTSGGLGICFRDDLCARAGRQALLRQRAYPQHGAIEGSVLLDAGGSAFDAGALC